MYMMIKHLHMTAVALSVFLFIIRFYWSLADSSMMQKKWVKITPHIVDTLLLATAIALCVLITQYPFVNDWLTQKVIGVVLYILAGLWVLKWAKSNLEKWLGFVGAIAIIGLVAKMAVSKQPLLFL